jgi:hypothetical protein
MRNNSDNSRMKSPKNQPNQRIISSQSYKHSEMNSNAITKSKLKITNGNRMTWWQGKKRDLNRKGKLNCLSMRLSLNNSLIKSSRGNNNKFNWKPQTRRGSSKYRNSGLTNNSKSKRSSIVANWLKGMIRNAVSSKMKSKRSNKIFSHRLIGWTYPLVRKTNWEES